MKIKLVTVIAAMALLPIAGFSQTPPPPPPPQPPGPQRPPEPPRHHDKAPKVPMTFLGVETSQVPDVVSEQLGLSKGLGLVVEYVQPNSPAAQAGLQQNDILKTLNEQILIEPSQLRKLLQTFPEGTDVTLTVLRKGQEQKVTVKLAKKEMPQRHSLMLGGDHDWDFDDTGDLGEEMKGLKDHLKEQLGEAQRGMIRDAADKAREATRRAREDARRAAREIRMLSRDNGAIKATKIDLSKAQVVFCDDHGEMKLQNVNGKKLLTAKDPQGKLLFSGPVETKEDLDKVPADVRQRYEKLEHNDLREVAPGVQAWDVPMPPANADDDDETDADDDEGDNPQSVSDQFSIESFFRQPSDLNSI